MIRKKAERTPAHLQCSSTSIWQKVTNLRAVKQVHALFVVNGFNTGPSAIRELIFASAISIFGAIDYAHQLFDQIPEPNIFTWNTMIRGSAQSADPARAVYLYTQMDRRAVRPDHYTFPFVLKACTRLRWVDTGQGIHGRIMKLGFELNVFTRNTLIYFHANCGDIWIAKELFDDSAKRGAVAWSAMTSGYARRGDMDNARQVFNEMPIKDMVSWNVMITAYAKGRDMQKARELFDQVSRKDVVTWNAMISGYVNCGCQKQALEVYEEMRCSGVVPDEVTMLSLLSACADLGDLQIGKKIHSSILLMGLTYLDVLLGNALIDMYAKCGDIDRAVEVFHSMSEKDVSSWNSILGGLAFHGYAKETLELFAEMEGKKIRPNGITFAVVLIACSHAGSVKQGQDYFRLMKDGYGIEPNTRHYGCIVDMLGRAGLLAEAFDFVEKMKVEPNAVIWRTLLGASRVHGNVELGRKANEELLKKRHDESGDYVLLSNIYASIDDWNEAETVRNLMDDSGVKKEHGSSIVKASSDDF